jgi:hypothetical protein
MSILSKKLMEFANSPQGKKLAVKAQEFANDPKTKEQVEKAKLKLAELRANVAKHGAADAKPDEPGGPKAA